MTWKRRTQRILHHHREHFCRVTDGLFWYLHRSSLRGWELMVMLPDDDGNMWGNGWCLASFSSPIPHPLLRSRVDGRSWKQTTAKVWANKKIAEQRENVKLLKLAREYEGLPT